MCPIAESDGHDGPRLGLELVPSIAAVIEQRVSVVEDPVGEPVVAYVLPDVLLRVQLGTLRRQWHDGDVVGHLEFV